MLFQFLLLHKSINIEIFTVGMPSLIFSQLLKATVQWHFWPFLAIFGVFGRFWPFLSTFESSQLLEVAVQLKQEAHSHLHFEPVEYLQFKISYVRIKALMREVRPDRSIRIKQFLRF